MIYSLAPSEHIDMGKTWLVYTVQLRALGHRAYGLNKVRATSGMHAHLMLFSGYIVLE